jgi:hypothetical protein
LLSLAACRIERGLLDRPGMGGSLVAFLLLRRMSLGWIGILLCGGMVDTIAANTSI